MCVLFSSHSGTGWWLWVIGLLRQRVVFVLENTAVCWAWKQQEGRRTTSLHGQVVALRVQEMDPKVAYVCFGSRRGCWEEIGFSKSEMFALISVCEASTASYTSCCSLPPVPVLERRGSQVARGWAYIKRDLRAAPGTWSCCKEERSCKRSNCLMFLFL